MPSIIVCRVCACAALVLVLPSSAAGDAPPVLTCGAAQDESAALRQAPRGAVRKDAHVLEVTTARGVQRFVDKVAVEGLDLTGRRWRYCGYDADVGAHLIEVSAERVRTGDLLFDATGRLQLAGHTVLFAPDRQAYLAVEQEDRRDGATWTVFDFSGRPRWKGSAAALPAAGAAAPARFEGAAWTARGALVAQYVCATSGRRGSVTFGKDGAGGWGWLGFGGC